MAFVVPILRSVWVGPRGRVCFVLVLFSVPEERGGGINKEQELFPPRARFTSLQTKPANCALASHQVRRTGRRGYRVEEDGLISTSSMEMVATLLSWLSWNE